MAMVRLEYKSSSGGTCCFWVGAIEGGGTFEVDPIKQFVSAMGSAMIMDWSLYSDYDGGGNILAQGTDQNFQTFLPPIRGAKSMVISNVGPGM